MRIFALIALATLTASQVLTPPELPVPVEIHFNDSNVIHNMSYEARRAVLKNHTDGNSIMLNFTTRMICYKGSCGIPGPTFVFYPGVTARLRYCNMLVGVGQDKAHPNNLRDPDVTNLHIHGMHVSSIQDDIVNISINPMCDPMLPASEKNPCSMNGPDCWIYNWTIPMDHYPGSHWYHAHRHGSVTLQVAGGAYGLIRVAPLPAMAHYEPDMPYTPVLLSYGWFVDREACFRDTQGCSDTPAFPFRYPGSRGGFELPSTCWLYCQILPNQRMFSGVPYDVDVGMYPNGTKRIDNVFYIINGKYNPQITMSTGKWRRIRFVVTAINYLFYTLHDDGNGHDCDQYLMATDGIWVKPGPRNIRVGPYNGVVIVPIGGRADIAIRCLYAGTYRLTALSYEGLTTEQKLVLGDVLGNYELPTPETNHDILTLNVVGQDMPQLRGNLTGLPTKVQPYPDYLKDTLNATNVTTVTHVPNTGAQSHQRNLHFPSPIAAYSPNAINNIHFDSKIPLMTFQTGVVHEWTVHIHWHPFHHHTWPFQVQHHFPVANETLNKSYDGWFVRRGDWRDTLGALGAIVLRANYITFLEGMLIIHCHFVEHEDHGMMAWMNLTAEPLASEPAILPPEQIPDYDCPMLPQPYRGKVIVNTTTLSAILAVQINVLGTCGYEFIFTGVPRQAVDVFWVGWGFNGNYTNNPSLLLMDGNAVLIQFGQNATNAQDFRVYEMRLYSAGVYKQLDNKFSCKSLNYTSSMYTLHCIRYREMGLFENLDKTQMIIWAYGEGIAPLSPSDTYGFPHLNRGSCQLTMASGLEMPQKTCFYSGYVKTLTQPSSAIVPFPSPASTSSGGSSSSSSTKTALEISLGVIFFLVVILIMRYMGYLKCECCPCCGGKFLDTKSTMMSDYGSVPDEPYRQSQTPASLNEGKL